MGTPTMQDVQCVENVATGEEARRQVHIHAKTIIAVIAIDFIVMAQLMAVVGSGLLAQSTTTLLGDPSKAVWLSTIITIFTLALNPPVSQAADLWGRKSVIIITSIGGIVGPLVISRARNMSTLIGGFCILGIAFSCQSSFYAVPSEILPRRYRAIGQASVNMSSGLAAMIAVLMGGGLLRNNNFENYRVFWYVTAGLYAAGTAGVVVGYNPPPRELQTSLTTSEKLRRLDWIGIFLIAGGLTLFSVALQWSGNPYGWTDAPVLAPFIIGVIMVISFGIYEWRFKHDGIMHHGLFGDRNFVIALLAIFVEGLAFFTTNSYFAFEVSLLYRLNLFEAGLRFMMVFIGSIVFAFLVGIYTTWSKRIREPLILGFVILLIFNALMATVKSSTSINTLWAYPLIGGVALGFLLTNVIVAAQMSTPAEMISVTTGLMTAIRSLGAAVGLAVNNAIFSNTLSPNLPTKVAAAVVPLGFPATSLRALIGALSSGKPEVIAQVPGVTPQIIGAGAAALTEAFLLSFRNTWIAAACFCVVGVIASCFFRNPQYQFTAHIDAPAEADLAKLQAEVEAVETEAAMHEHKNNRY